MLQVPVIVYESVRKKPTLNILGLAFTSNALFVTGASNLRLKTSTKRKARHVSTALSTGGGVLQ